MQRIRNTSTSPGQGERLQSQTSRLLIAAVITPALLMMAMPFPLSAAEPVSVVVEGLEGEVLKNVGEALALPSGLVRDGVVCWPVSEFLLGLDPREDFPTP